MARYLGVHDSGHVFEKLDTGAILYPSHCMPVNELELIRDSLPAGAAVHSTESQTMSVALPVHALPNRQCAPPTLSSAQPTSTMHILPPIGTSELSRFP